MFGGAFDDRVRMALLCDYALTSEDGKISAIGIFSSISFASLPANYPRFYVVIIASLTSGNHAAQIQMLGPAGNEILPSGPPMNLDVPDPANETNLIIGFDNLTFEQPGLHQLQFMLNGDVALSLPFSVMTSEQEGYAVRGNA
jgi:hypothetical protein